MQKSKDSIVCDAIANHDIVTEHKTIMKLASMIVHDKAVL